MRWVLAILVLSPVLHGHGCGCWNLTRVRVSDLANPKKQDSEIRLISFLFLNFTNKYAGTGLKVRQKAQKTQPTGHKKGEKGPFEGPTLHIKASDHEREKKARLKAQHSTVVPSDHLPHPLAASLAFRRQFVFLSLPHTALAATSSSSSLSQPPVPAAAACSSPSPARACRCLRPPSVAARRPEAAPPSLVTSARLGVRLPP